MEIIRKPVDLRIMTLGKQQIVETEKYRPLTFSTYVEVEKGLLIYNNLTDELILLSNEEKEALKAFDTKNDICKELIEKWYYVPEAYSDVKLANDLSNFMSFMSSSDVNGTEIYKYTIFPTTDCNARCFYCYEKDVKKIHMSDKVAEDAADYIIKHCGGKKVIIRWFGGEPLYNSRAIDIISKKLRDANVKYTSAMITNGYLFDDQIVERAHNLWHLTRVQITLDGTEEKYNKIKAFIHDDPNPFKRVIDNIEKLLKADTLVIIRMNMDSHNYENLYELVNFLAERFKGYKRFRMYSQTLFDESSEAHMNRTDEVRDERFLNNLALNDYICELKLGEVNTLNLYLKNRQCMADDDNSTTITPEGNLGKCEHFSDRYFWGSIYSDKVNRENIDKFKLRVTFKKECDTCPVRPGCVQLEHCPDARRCNDVLQKSHIENVKNRILNSYKWWQKKNNQN